MQVKIQSFQARTVWYSWKHGTRIPPNYWLLVALKWRIKSVLVGPALKENYRGYSWVPHSAVGLGPKVLWGTLAGLGDCTHPGGVGQSTELETKEVEEWGRGSGLSSPKLKWNTSQTHPWSPHTGISCDLEKQKKLEYLVWHTLIGMNALLGILELRDSEFGSHLFIIQMRKLRLGDSEGLNLWSAGSELRV